MDRRNFIKTGGAVALAAGLGSTTAKGFVSDHVWDKYNFGCGPAVKNRLNQGPFPTYPPEQVVPGSDVVMMTTPSKQVIPNFGMGLITYMCDEVGPPKKEGESLAQSLENLAQMTIGSKMYIRLDWKDLQKNPGKLELCEHWQLVLEMAQKYNKRVGFRVQLQNPEIPGHAVPDFVAEKVPFVKLGTTDQIGLRGKVQYVPRYDHPAFMSALQEFDAMLADMYNGHPLIEYMDTYMYGFWGEGHTWPFDGNPFPDYITAEQTFIKIFEMQLQNWSKVPLTTNTQPDYSRVGNSELLDRTIRSHNWLRTDTIYIENSQIEALSNRPPWIGATIECGISDGAPETTGMREGITRSDGIIYHAQDVGANYFSLWNWHRILADRILNYYRQFPDAIDELDRCIGYRVRPSWIWQFDKDEHPGLVLGMVNDGIAAVPGVLYITVFSDDGKVNVCGGLDAGYPLPGKVRQAQIILPKGTEWKGLKVKAEIEVKGVRYPVRWACHQQTNPDGSLTLQPNLR